MQMNPSNNNTQNPSAPVDFRQTSFTPPTNRSEKRILIFLLVVRNLVEAFHRKYDSRDSHSISVSMPLDQLIDLLHQQLESSLIGFPSTSSFSKTEIIEILHELEKSFSIGKLADFASKTGENIASSSAARANYYECVIEKFHQDQALDAASKTAIATATTSASSATTDVLVSTLVEFTVNPWRSGLTDLTVTSLFAQTVQQRLVSFIPPPLRSPMQFDSLKMKFFYEALQRAADSGVVCPDEVLNLRPIIPPILADNMISSNLNENSNKNKTTLSRNSHHHHNHNNSSVSSATVLAQIDAELNSQSGGVFLPEKDLLLGLSQRHRLAPQVAIPIVNELVRQGKLVKCEYALGLTNNNGNNNNNNGNSILGMKHFSPLIGISSLVNSDNAIPTTGNGGSDAVLMDHHNFSSNNKTVPFFTPSKFPTFVSRPLYDRFSLPAAFHCALFAYRILGSSSAMLRSDVVSCLQHLGWKNVTILNALIDFLISSTRLKLLVAFSLANNPNKNKNNNNDAPLQYLAISEEAKEMFETARKEVMEKMNNNNNNNASSQVVQIRDAAAVEFYNDLKKALLSAGVSGWPKDYLLRLMKIKFNWTESDLEARFFPLLKSWGLIHLSFDPKQNCTNITITNYNTKVNSDEPMNTHKNHANGNNNNSNYFSALSSSSTALASSSSTFSLKTATKVYFENLHDLVPPGGLEKSSVITLMNHKHGWKEERTQLEFLSELVSRNLVREVRDAVNPGFVKIFIVSSANQGDSGFHTANQPTADLENVRSENSGIKRASLTSENTPVLKIISTFAPNYYISKLGNEEKAKLFLLEYFKMAADQVFGGAATAQQKLCLHLNTLASPQVLQELEDTIITIVQQFKANNSTLHQQHQQQQHAKKIQKSLLFLWIADNVEKIHGKNEREEILKSLIGHHKILVESEGSADGTTAVYFHPDFASCFSPKVTKEDVESDFHESDAMYSYFEDHYLKMICSAPKATSEVRRTQARFLVSYFRFASIGKREKEPLRANTLQVPKDSFMKWLVNDMGKRQKIVKNQKDFDDLINVLVKSGYLLIVFGGGKQLITLNPAFAGNIKPELFVVPTKPSENQRAEMQRQLNAQQQQQQTKIVVNSNIPNGMSGQRRSRSSTIININNNNNYNHNRVPPPPHHNPVLHIDASNYHLYHQQEEDDFFSENDQTNTFQPPALVKTNVNFPPQQHIHHHNHHQQQQAQQQFQQPSSFLDQSFVQADFSVDDRTNMKKADSAISHDVLVSASELLQRVKLPWPHRNPISFPPPLKVVAGVPYFRSKEIYARLMWGPPPFVPNK